MALSRVIGACALASLATSAWAKDGPETSSSSSSPTLSTKNNSAAATPGPGNLTNPSMPLSIPLKRYDSRAGGSTSVQRRYFKTNVLGVYGAAYLAELSVGTSADPQKVDVLLDTGSFELWVNPDCAKSNVPEFCKGFGQYDPSKSSTSKNLEQGFSIQYGSGSTSGIYYTDDVFISGAKITGQQFGVANTSDLVWFGIMGLARGKGNGFLNYNTVLDSVVAQGFANSRLFSLDLGSQGPPGSVISGEIVFGGVDTNKYAGNLVKVAIDPADSHYSVLLTGLTHRPPTAQTANPVLNTQASFPVIVDSGTTLSLLPQALVEALAAQFPGATTDGQGGFRVACSYQQQPGTVSFTLATSFSPSASNITINLPYSEFVWNAGNDNCYLGAWYDASVSVHILGDTFLRGAYVVFDQDSNALYMADYVACGGAGVGTSSDGGLVPVPAGQDAVLGIRGSCVPPGGAGGTGGENGASSSSVVLPGGPVTSSGLGGSVVPTINPAGPVSVTSSATATGTAGASTATAPGTTPATSSLPPGGVSSLPGVSATSAPTVSSGPGLDPNAVPAGGSGAATSATPAAGGLPLANDPDPNVRIGGTGTGTGTMSGTITRTVTNLIVTTVTACPTSAVTSGAACVLGQVTTRTSVYVTTICPDETAKPVPASAGSGAALTAPAPAPASATGGGAGAGAAAAAAPGGAQAPQQPGGAVFVTVKEQCHTSTYAVTSCAPNAAGCTVGMTTTQMFTEYRTVTATAPGLQAIQASPVAAGTPGGGAIGGNVGYSPASGTALPPAVQVGGGAVSSVEAGPYSNISSSNSFSSSNGNLSGGGSSGSSSSSSGDGNGVAA
ncbi:eukaryotic aspartyl protease, partial [Apiospora marii]|uniref:eukaryotic aspartyl protease n=1 Tax=Apiospora marii TaxID=335849 RepID=UPI003131B293